MSGGYGLPEGYPGSGGHSADPRFGGGYQSGRWRGSSRPQGSGGHRRSGSRRAGEDVRDEAGQALRKRPAKASGGWVLARELIAVVLVAALLSWSIKTFLVQPFNIPSGSMMNTLLVGDRIMVSKLSPQWRPLRRGDIVVFRDPGNWLSEQERSSGVSPFGWMRDGFEFIGLAPADKNDDLVKRLIGIPGDTVKCCDAQGKMTVNGVPLQEDYLYPGDAPAQEPFQAYVPPGSLWMMGDHRSGSEDSRYNQNKDPDHGLVPIDNVVGRVFMVAFPLSHARKLHRPSTFDQPGLQPDVVHE